MKVESIHLRSVFPFLGENDRDPVLTVYLPDNLTQMGRGDQLRPGLLVIPGGGYAMVSEREAEPIALNFLSEGYNVFVLTYSVAPNRFPVQLREVAAALEVIWYSASDWHVDVSKIAIMGFSAGGHLACHYSNCYQIPEVREYFPDSKGVQAAVLCYSVITADPEYSHKGSFKNLTGHDPLTEEDIEQVYELYCNYEDVVDKSKVVTLDDIKAKDYSLAVNNYIEKSQVETIDPTVIRKNYLDAVNAVISAENHLRELLMKEGLLNE